MKLILHTAIAVTLINLCVEQVTGLNILAVFPYNGKSHFYVFEPYVKELAKRGHHVTVISHFPQKQSLKNYEDISLAGEIEVLEDVFPVHRSYVTLMNILLFLVGTGTENCRVLLNNKKVQNLWKSKVKYDLVLVELFNSDCSLGLAHQLGAPVVGLTTCQMMPHHYNRFGIPWNPSNNYLLLEGGTKPTLYQRFERIVVNTIFNVMFRHMSQKQDQKTLIQHFGDTTPDLEELAQDVKMVLLYHNFVLTGSRLFPAHVKEVGGYHVAPAKSLPNDLKKFIEEAKHGVIYISFGSMLRATTLPKDKYEAIIGVIKDMPQRFIWKWEEKNLPGDPSNVYVSDWLPQNDILAHPNVLAFYSHCGLLGTTEAIHHGVPMVGMPIFGDQPSNAAAIEESGLGVYVDIKYLTKEKLQQAFKTVLDPKFRSNVKELSKAWHDRPVSPMDSAIFWTEYVARHQNITYKPTYVDLPFYEYYCLDILAIFIVIIVILSALVKNLLFSSNSSKNKIKNKSKKE